MIAEIKDKASAYAKKNPKSALMISGLGTLGFLMLVGGSLIINAIIYGLIIVAAFGVIFWKLTTSTNKIARELGEFLRKHSLMTDAGVTAVAFMTGPSGVTAAIGAGVACLATSVILGMIAPAKVEQAGNVASRPAVAAA